MMNSAVAELDSAPKLLDCPHDAADNPWRKSIQGMSFPRSGHHLLIALLHAYFGPTFNYCEYYNGCRTWPCKRSLNNFQKNHDLELQLQPFAGLKYLVQIRHPWPAMISHYRLRVKMGWTRIDSRESWEAHRQKDMNYYRGFIEKWVLPDHPSRLLLRYDHLLRDPEERLADVVRLFDDHIDADACRQAVESCRVGGRQSWTDFPYSSEQAIAEAESINCLQLPLI